MSLEREEAHTIPKLQVTMYALCVLPELQFCSPTWSCVLNPYDDQFRCGFEAADEQDGPEKRPNVEATPEDEGVRRVRWRLAVITRFEHLLAMRWVLWRCIRTCEMHTVVFATKT